MNERSPCGLSIIGDKYLSMSRDQKVMTLLTQWRNTLWTSIKELFLLPEFDNSSPSVTRDKHICDLLREKGPTAIKRRFKMQLTTFSL